MKTIVLSEYSAQYKIDMEDFNWKVGKKVKENGNRVGNTEMAYVMKGEETVYNFLEQENLYGPNPFFYKNHRMNQL